MAPPAGARASAVLPPRIPSRVGWVALAFGLRVLALATLAPGCLGTHGSGRGTLPSTVAPDARAMAPAGCVTALTSLIPTDATSWLIVRPRAMFSHPRLGRALGRAFDDAGERALITRSQRTGYDVRAVDRALLAWSPGGSLAVGIGSFDAARIVELLWSRLLPPRRRGDAGTAVTRIEGVLGRSPVSLAVQSACGVAAWAEGDTRRVDRAILPGAGGSDPVEALVWHARELPDAVGRQTSDALIRRMHDLEVRAEVQSDGVAVSLTLAGDVPPDGEARLRGAVQALVRGPLGEAVGAGQWLSEDRVAVTHDAQHLALHTTVPWRGLDALADVLRGQVGAADGT